MRNLWLAGAAVGALLLGGTVADAGEIVLDPGGAWGFDFVSIGGGRLQVCTLNCLSPISGQAFYVAGGSTGTFTLGPVDYIAGPNVAGNFAAGSNVETFEYLGNDGDALSGLVTWAEVVDGSLNPTLRGSLTVASVVGDAAFTSDYRPGGVAAIEATDRVACSLTDLVAGACPTGIQESPMVSGSITPHGTPVPEPSAFSLLLLALGSLAWWRTVT